MGISLIFLIAGLIILIGFLGSFSFEKTKVPDVLLLLSIGIILGPILKLVDPHQLTQFAEYFGALALMIILFEGGMDIDIDKLLKEFGTASVLVFISFILSTLCIAFYLYYTYAWELVRSLLLGSILGCTSAAIVIPVANRMMIKDEIKILLSVESALSDVIAIIMTVSIVEFVKLEHIGIEQPFRAVASSFSIAIVAGVLSGLSWLKILEIFKNRKYSYMTTLATMLIIFAIVDFLGGSGPIAILIFGIILGNSHDFNRFLKIKDHNLVDETIKFFNGEVSFFVRTFFFVYMGMIISFKLINTQFFLLCFALLLIIVLMRYISVTITGFIYKDKKEDRFAMLSMLPRGLASAVLATIPASANIKGTEVFIDYTFGVVVLTNILMTVGVFITEKKAQAKIS